jgi:uncharacterized protein YpbB
VPAKKSSVAKKTTGSQTAANFAETFAALKNIFARHSAQLVASVDKPGRYYSKSRSAIYRGKPLFFGAVISQKNYVSFHLMPIYMNPALQKKVSPTLQKRKQGKACFNFTAPDPVLFRELAALTAEACALFHAKGFSEKLAKSVADAKRKRSSRGASA